VAAPVYVVAGKATDSVTHGFLPAAARLGLKTILLTDRPSAHTPRNGPASSERPTPHTFQNSSIVECNVSDFRDIIARVTETPGGIFSNSDFLQAPTALAAAYFGLPGKGWQAATRTKNKALMRRHLAALDPVFSADAFAVSADAPFPLVLKPREGVASEDVFLVRDIRELIARREEIAVRRGDPLVAEEYLPGALHTLETLGDGRELRVLGSFRTRLSPPPFFVEERLEWAPPPPETPQVLAQLDALGVGFGACHTEFVVHQGRARIIEVNYRLIGDHCDFLLADLLGVPLFEHILRIHLGERLEPDVPRPRGHAVAEPIIADRPGTLTVAPGAFETNDGAVRLAYRPQRRVGDVIAVTGTNRDYLGTVRAIGPDADQVESALVRFRDAHTWTIA